MSEDGRRRLIAIATLGLPLLTGIAIIAVGHFAGNAPTVPHTGEAVPEATRRSAAAPVQAGGLAPRMKLEDAATGRPFDSGSLTGTPYAVLFASTRCPGLGRELRQVLQALDGSRGQPLLLVISTAPQVDSPARVRAWLRRNRITAGIRYLVGSSQQMRPLWAAWGEAQGDGCETPLFHLVNAAGRNAGVVALAPGTSAAGLAADLIALSP